LSKELHFKPSRIDDDYETPPELVKLLCEKFQVTPMIDVAATGKNRKFTIYFSKENSALDNDWTLDCWCNHPHTLHKEFVEKAYNEWKKHNITIMMIIPSNTGRTKYWHEFIEPYAEYKMIKGNIRFLKDGKPTKDAARNGYVCVIWRKIIE
jgi:phage N-6-adenine-methyltransferase